jgi:hypothetical protein
MGGESSTSMGVAARNGVQEAAEQMTEWATKGVALLPRVGAALSLCTRSRGPGEEDPPHNVRSIIGKIAPVMRWPKQVRAS